METRNSQKYVYEEFLCLLCVRTLYNQAFNTDTDTMAFKDVYCSVSRSSKEGNINARNWDT